MQDETLNPHWINAFRTVFTLCKASAHESIVVLTEQGSRVDNVQLAQRGLEEMGMCHTVLELPYTTSPVGPIIRSTGASLALNDHPEAVEQLCEADFVIDLTVEGLMHAEQTGRILRSGARILNISNEHPEILARLTPTLNDKEMVQTALGCCRSASLMHVASEAGTNLRVELAKSVSVGVWGWTDRPGTLSHWPAGLVVCFPVAASVNGKLVMAPGDMNLTFKRYLESAVTLTIEDDFIVDIAGDGADAALMRRYLQGFNEPEAYATSHVGWGLNPKARYEALTMYDKSDTNGTELRALSGNFLYSTGSNEFAKRFTRGHFDLPIMNCDIYLDDEAVVKRGRIVE
ncbi:MAG: peptidase M29 [Gammaproteobacteria bacterium]|nr:peptidase M29 [Gammaproteobacteria bacterium]